MIALFKIMGFLLVSISGWGYGAYKSFDLNEKRKNLYRFCMGIEQLYDSIRVGCTETVPLVNKIFDEYSLLIINSCVIKAKDKKFYKKDERIINEFFEGLGKSDKLGECNRIIAYKEVIERRYNEINEEYKSKSKVWQTVGVCFGITVALLMI